MIYYIPIEPLDERYTEQWYRWFPQEFKRQNKEFTVIDGTPLLEGEIETGTFLDVNSSAYYKATQLQEIAKLFYLKKIKDGDTFFVADIEFSGIESIKYLSTLNNIDTKLFGFAHAASYTKEDFFAKTESFAKYYENGWFNTFDKIFVGSEYHKNQILKLRTIINSNNIIVTGNPYNIKEETDKIGQRKKKNQIVCTNRPDYEKRPNLTLDVFAILKKKYPEWEFIVTTGRKQWGDGWIHDKAKLLEEQNVITITENLQKSEYLSILSESKIMTGNTIEENFGYCVLESLIFDTIPVIPNDYSHIEILENDSLLLFDSIDDQVKKIEYFIDNEYNHTVLQYATKYENSLKTIVNYL